MKFFFLSDIHGSLYYLERALERFEAEKADKLVILGDELYHGPRNPLTRDYNPMEVANRLNTMSDKIIAVRGNCDSEIDAMVLAFPMFSDFTTIFDGTRRIFLTHGHVYSPEKLPPLGKGDVFAFGHFHLPIAETKDGIHIVNPGSIALPKDGNPHSYGVLEGDTFHIKDLSGQTFKQLSL